MKLAFKLGTIVLLILSGLIFIVYTMVSKKEEGSKNLPKLSQVAPFQLIDQDGQIFSEEALKGKVWVVDFIFTRCKGPCPLMTEKMAKFQKNFEGNENIHFVTITMDADFDSPGVLKKFAEEYGANFSKWHFLTGKSDDIISIARNIFKVPAESDPEMHTTRFVLVDADGFIRSYHDSLDSESLDTLKKHLELLEKNFNRE
jgi:protein SCO1/2